MIRIGSNRIGRALVKDINVNWIYLGPKLVWGREVELLQMFKASVLADGGIFDEELFTTEFFRQSALVRNESVVLIVCGAYKAGVIYGVNCITGQAVPFTFGRASVGTYIDKNGLLQTVGNNIPRIDYDPITLELRGYLNENGVSNLISNSLLDGNTTGWVVGTEGIISYNQGISSTGRSFIQLNRISGNTTSLATNPITSSANTTYLLRVTLRAGSINSCRIGLGSVADPGGSGAAWGGNDYTGHRIISGPGSISTNNGLKTIVNLSATEDTVIEMYRTYVNPGIGLSVWMYTGTASMIPEGSNILISTPQLETAANGTSGTSQIDTSVGQGTRAADELRISDGSLINDAASSIYIEGSRLSNGAGTNFYLSRGGTDARFWYTNSLVTQTAMYDGTTVNSANSILNGVNGKIVGSVGAEGQKINTNSNIYKAVYDGTFGSGTIYLGGRPTHTGRVQNHLRAFAIIHRQLSDAEHIALTT